LVARSQEIETTTKLKKDKPIRKLLRHIGSLEELVINTGDEGCTGNAICRFMKHQKSLRSIKITSQYNAQSWVKFAHFVYRKFDYAVNYLDLTGCTWPDQTDIRVISLLLVFCFPVHLLFPRYYTIPFRKLVYLHINASMIKPAYLLVIIKRNRRTLRELHLVFRPDGDLISREDWMFMKRVCPRLKISLELIMTDTASLIRILFFVESDMPIDKLKLTATRKIPRHQLFLLVERIIFRLSSTEVTFKLGTENLINEIRLIYPLLRIQNVFPLERRRTS